MDAEKMARELLADTVGLTVEQLAMCATTSIPEAVEAVKRALSPPASAAVVPEAKAIVQRAIDGLVVPKMSPSKTEYFTAGVRHLVRAINAEFRAATPSPPVGEKGEGS